MAIKFDSVTLDSEINHHDRLSVVYLRKEGLVIFTASDFSGNDVSVEVTPKDARRFAEAIRFVAEQVEND